MEKIYKSGLGYDVHAFAEERPLILGGVNIPFEKGLAGHSDADVLTHAISDAILGALALGDIGEHFPDNDQKYKDISSLVLLEDVIELTRQQNANLVHVDAVIIAQMPKINPYKSVIKESLLRYLKPASLNIKATTTEKLGFTGRGEGIAAQAVATLCFQEN